MPNYAPMSKETHLARGSCCHRGCVYCPWYTPRQHTDIAIDPRIEHALRSGETVTIYSDRVSLVPSVTLQDRVTIVYRGYKPYLKLCPKLTTSPVATIATLM